MNLVVTACTNRKKAPPALGLRAETLSCGEASVVANEWLDRLSAVSGTIQARHLYAGRGFQEASQAAAGLAAKLIIISAGLGAVDEAARVPSYALSVTGGSSDNVLTRIDCAITSREWWGMVTGGSPFSTSLAEAVASSDGAVIVALSESYLSMVDGDLAALDPDCFSRLRIITRAHLERIDPRLHPLVMPYDDRLDGPDSPIRGTRGDFAQRAARHFSNSVLARDPNGAAADHAALVSKELATWRAAPVFERVRHDDETLLRLMTENWSTAQGQSGKLLRVLRDDLNVACEQGRFVGLMSRLRRQLAMTS